MCHFTYKDGTGNVVAVDRVYKYPCACGGTTIPQRTYARSPVRAPDVTYFGPCGGTIMVIVGVDDALLTYGIRGQWVAVDIVH